ncbi:MAG: hypothetical protein ABI691_18270 [Ginsengibacter sp.]
MNKQLLLLICLFYINAASAQKEKQYPVKVGEIPNKVLPREAMYLSPAFNNGTAFFRDGTSSERPFNYNFLLDEMHFLDNAGDTLAIANPELLSSVVIDSIVFYFDRGYLRQLSKQGNYKLALKQEMVQIADKTRGAYDVASGSSSIKTYGYINNSNSRIYKLQVEKDVLFKEVKSYYISDASGHFLKADKKSFYTLFEGDKPRQYLRAHKVNFNNEEDLRSLLMFCAK